MKKERALISKVAMEKTVSLLLLLVLLTGCQTDTFTHKHFPDRVARIHTIGLLPQVHTAMLDTYFGKDPSPAPLPEEQQIRSELIAATIEQLQQRGFMVKDGSVPDGTNDIWSGRMIQQACSKQPSKAARPDAKVLAISLNVDGLIFLDATAYKSTPHRKKITTTQNVIAALTLPAILIGVPPVPEEMLQGAAAQIALVDGKTGDVLWTTADYFGDFEKNKPTKAVEDLFRRYPKRNKQ